MNSAGKKLQDIYDAGSAKLRELQTSQETSLKNASDSHGSTAKTAQKAAAEGIQKRAQELNNDITDSLSKSTQKISKAIENETQQTEKYLKTLLTKISELSTKLQDSITELRDTHAARNAALSEDVCDLYEREFEANTSALRKRDYDSAQSLKVQGRFVMNSFQQKLDHSLVETRGEERQISSRLFKAFLQQSNSIDTHAATLGQQISEKYAEHSETLKAASQEGEAKLQQVMESLVEDGEKHAVEVEQEIHELFERINFESATKSDDIANAAVTSLKEIHDTNVTEVSGLTSELQKDLRSVSSSVKTNIEKITEDDVARVDQTLESFNAECKKRMDAISQLEKDLDAKSAEIVTRIKKDLAELERAFTEKMNEAEKKALDHLETATKSGDDAITKAEQDSEDQLKNLASASRNQIDSLSVALLKRIQEKRSSAVDEVMNAAGASVGTTEESSESSKSSKKSKGNK
jgi:hypothetical protein